MSMGFDFKVEKVIADIGGNGASRTLLTSTAFGKKPVKMDLRRWQITPDGEPEIPLKGLSLSRDELIKLRDVLNSMDELKGGD